MSCLFDSFSEYLRIQERKNISSYSLRQQICDYLHTDPIMLDDHTTKLSELLKTTSLNSYIANMRRSGTWGSAFEINAFCNLYHVKVNVKVLLTRKDIMFYPLTCCPFKIVNLEWTGSHYTYITNQK